MKSKNSKYCDIDHNINFFISFSKSLLKIMYKYNLSQWWSQFRQICTLQHHVWIQYPLHKVSNFFYLLINFFYKSSDYSLCVQYMYQSYIFHALIVFSCSIIFRTANDLVHISCSKNASKKQIFTWNACAILFIGILFI